MQQTIFEKLMKHDAKQGLPEDKPSMSLELITPAIAEEMLARNKNNRDVNRQHLRMLVNEIIVGRWEVTNNAIALDKDGNLLDGQHRLLAIVETGRTVPSYVARGIAVEARKVIDKNKVRMLTHDMKMRGESWCTSKPGVVRVCALAMIGKLHSPRDLDMRTEHIYDLWREPFNDGLEALLPIIYGHQSLKCLRNSAVVGALVFAYRANPEMVIDFAKKLATGENMMTKAPAMALRNYFMRSNVTSRATNAARVRESHCMKVWYAVHAHLAGREIMIIKERMAIYEYFLSFYQKEIGEFTEYKLMTAAAKKAGYDEPEEDFRLEPE